MKTAGETDLDVCIRDLAINVCTVAAKNEHRNVIPARDSNDPCEYSRGSTYKLSGCPYQENIA